MNNIYGAQLLGRTVAEKRKSLGLSIRQLSSNTNITRDIISKIENGKIEKMNIDSINRIIIFLDIKINIDII